MRRNLQVCAPGPGARTGRRKLERTILISCAEVRHELSNYLENDVTTELRARIEQHVLTCTGCKAIYDGVKNVLRLVTSSEVIELPPGFSLRLYRRLFVDRAS